jgi:predicted O-methyltransferase YrrM
MDHFYQNLEGWFTFPELYSKMVAALSKNGIFVEVGVWKGKSLAYFIVESVNNNKPLNIYAVDTWKGSPEHKDESAIIHDTLFEEFGKNMAPVGDKFKAIRTTSKQASQMFADNSIDGIFIDAAHEYDAVKEDLELWYPKVKSGGYFCGHDYSNGWPGVVQAVNEFFANKPNELIMAGLEMSWAARKS